MASSSPLKDIDEKFCQCSICLGQFREPKLLPCIHRCCRDCLEGLLQDNTTTLRCPECREEFKLPKDGIDGFKTDFYMTNLITYIELQKSLEDNQIRECGGCGQHLKTVAYCLKCCEFLCEQCCKYHTNSKVLRDHRKHVLALKDSESRKLTLEKLSSLKDTPMCHIHKENVAQLCCITCGLTPICVACSYGSHMDHNLREVKTLATIEKEKVSRELATLVKFKQKLFDMPAIVERVRRETISNVSKGKDNIETKYHDRIKEINKFIEDICKKKERKKDDIERRERNTIASSKCKMEEEIKSIKEKYDKILDEERKAVEIELEQLDQNFQKELGEMNGYIQTFNEDFLSLMKSIETQELEKYEAIRNISNRVEDRIQRFQNLTSTAVNILKTGKDWTALQYAPDMSNAMGHLIGEVSEELPELETLPKIKVELETSSLEKELKM